MKKILFILSLVLLISCNGKSSVKENQSEYEQPQTTIIKSDNIQYNIKWSTYDNPVDIRIITLSKDDEIHDYVVANDYIGRGGGISIEHWAGCKCLKK